MLQILDPIHIHCLLGGDFDKLSGRQLVQEETRARITFGGFGCGIETGRV